MELCYYISCFAAINRKKEGAERGKEIKKSFGTTNGSVSQRRTDKRRWQFIKTDKSINWTIIGLDSYKASH